MLHGQFADKTAEQLELQVIMCTRLPLTGCTHGMSICWLMSEALSCRKHK